MSDSVLVDTSAWIEFLRDARSSVGDAVATLLRDGRACWTGLVAVELYRGAKGQAELDTLDDLLETVRSLPIPETLYRKAGRLCHRLARRGITVGTVDAMIATVALEHKCALLSLDRHFEDLQAHMGLKLLHV